MHSFINIDSDSKKIIKMIYQTDDQITLSFIGDSGKFYQKKFIDKIKNETISIVWSLKHQKQSYKIYKNVSILNSANEIVVLRVEDVSFYTGQYRLINTNVKFTKKKWNDIKTLVRIIKLSNLKNVQND